MPQLDFIPFPGGGGGGGGWTDDGALVRLTDVNDQVGIGTASPDPLAKVQIDAAAGGFFTGLSVLSGAFTVPGGGFASERFGFGADSPGDSSTAVGNGAVATNNETTVVGANASALTDGAIAMGVRATVASTPGAFAGGVAIGTDASVVAGADSGIAVGPQATASSSFGAVAIGVANSAGFIKAGTPLNNQLDSENIAIGDSARAGGHDSIAIGDGLIAGALDNTDLNVYSDIIAIGDGVDAGDVNNGAVQTVATGDGTTVSFSGVLAGTPIYRICVRWEYTIGGVLYVAQTGPVTFGVSTGTFGPHLGGPSNLNGNTGNFVLTFTTPPDNGTPITARPNFGSRDIVALGNGCFTRGSDCVAIGDGPTCGSDFNQSNCIAIGNGPSAEGNDVICIGQGASSSGVLSECVVIGHNAIATANEAVAIGHNASAGANQVAFLSDASTSVKFKVGTVNGMQFGASGTVKMGWYGATPIVRPTVTGSRGGNAALASLLTELANLGLIVDSTSA